ncbi:MAG TPA: siroheme synthase CysG [Woeseiaceae bacterium]|nr:siroheme synthase CysG [Woeseiaceae bacterium]
MQHLPVFLKLEGKPCLVVGGGAVAERKAALLARAGARVTVAAPGLTPGLRALADARRIRHLAEDWHERLLASQRLVIAATDDPAVNAAVARAAERRGVFCNVVDDGEASGFILPAIVDRSPVIVAIGTGGRAPVLAQRLKTALEAWLPARIGVLAERAGRWRALVAKRFATVDERRRFWQRFFDGPAARHLLAGRETEAERMVRRELVDGGGQPAEPAGEAWIVGAGPGDPGLLTLRARQLIGTADVVLYDRLVSRAVLDFARKEAELVPVGKAAGRQLATQEAINALLVHYVRAGKRVCRLKGGDPFVFGRGGEEARALAEAGLPYEVVPGVTAALGCAAYAGIPLTMRGMSGAVTFATARLDAGASPDWSALVRARHTLVLYMSAGSVEATASALVAHGAAADTPAAIVENGTTSRQRVLVATLADVAERARAAGIGSPALMIVGPTAALAAELAWFSPAGPWQGDAFQDPDSLAPARAAATTP